MRASVIVVSVGSLSEDQRMEDKISPQGLPWPYLQTLVVKGWKTSCRSFKGQHD